MYGFVEWPGNLAMSLEHLAVIAASVAVDLLVRSGDLESHFLCQAPFQRVEKNDRAYILECVCPCVGICCFA